MFVTVYMTGERCIYLKAFRWSYKISRKGRGDSTWVHASRAEDWLLLQPNAHKALSGYQGCTPDSGLLNSCIPAQTRAWKTNAWRLTKNTLLCVIQICTVKFWRWRSSSLWWVWNLMIINVQIKDCFSLLEVCNIFVCSFYRLLTHLRNPILLKGPKLWEQRLYRILPRALIWF